MVIAKRIIIGIIIVIIAVVVVRRFLVGDEHEIRKKMNLLAECISKKQTSSTATILLKTERLRTLFDTECSVSIPRYTVNRTLTPTEIVQRVAQVHRTVEELQVAFYDVTVDLIDKTHASVRCTVRASVVHDTRESESAEVICTLEKVDDKWVFTRFEQVPVLE